MISAFFRPTPFMRWLCVGAVLLWPAAELRAADNRYDVLANLLAPFINVLAKNSRNPNRAVAIRARLEQMTGLPADLAGTPVELWVQAPDRFRLHGPILGEELTLCRDGQRLWAAPGGKVQALLDLALAEKKLPKLDPGDRLEPLQLPVPEKQLAFLPALFQVQDAGNESLDGVRCRVLDVKLMPELERSLKSAPWAARVWVRPDFTPARLLLRRPDWEAVVKFETVKFSPSLPPETWQPGAASAAEVFEIDAPRFRQLLRALGY